MAVYNPYGYYPPMSQTAQPQQQIPQQQLQIQNGGFVSVRTEEEARNYPVAQGMSVTFKNETAPYIYTKTMGFSQLDRPIFEKFKLVKEDIVEKSPVSPDKDTNEFAMINDSIDEVKKQIVSLWREIDGLKEKGKPAQKKDKDGGE